MEADTITNVLIGFNTQPPEGGWRVKIISTVLNMVSTHSRPKAAGAGSSNNPNAFKKFQHTAARRRLARTITTTNPKRLFQHTAARRRLGPRPYPRPYRRQVFQHTAARRRLALFGCGQTPSVWFQHTAARRRLVLDGFDTLRFVLFQHTAARRRLARLLRGR